MVVALPELLEPVVLPEVFAVLDLLEEFFTARASAFIWFARGEIPPVLGIEGGGKN